ncbi:uroporphyrinogen decarboxylase [Spirochaetia bacterium]|nr:uroporphyrinogen decarboxylase [Spirochaetia bacterium]
MNKRELLLATIAGETTERLPCGFWHHFSDEEKYAEASIRAHKKYFDAVNPDMLKVMNEHMYQLDRNVSQAEDWRKVRRQKFEDTPYVDFVEEFKAIRKEIPAEVPMFATIHGVFVSGYHATEERPGDHFSDPDNLASRHLREDPESVCMGLRTIAETLAELAVKLKQAGADGIYYAALGGERYRFTREMLEKYVIPLDSYVIDAIRDAGLLSVLHICKDKVQLPSYKSINADIINWAVHDCEYSLADGRSLFPGKTLLGGFDDRSGILVEGSADEIRAEAEKILGVAGRKQFILGADCTLPDDIELWRVNTVQDWAAKK